MPLTTWPGTMQTTSTSTFSHRISFHSDLLNATSNPFVPQ